MSEKLFEIFGITFTVTYVYAILSAVVLLLFMTWWLLNRAGCARKDATGR